MRDWQARRTSMARVRYVIKGTRTVPKGTMTEDIRDYPEFEIEFEGEFPPRDHVVEVSRDVLIDFHRIRWRSETVEPPWPGFENHDYSRRITRQIRVFDGKTGYAWYPDMDDDHVQCIESRFGFVNADVRRFAVIRSPRPFPTCWTPICPVSDWCMHSFAFPREIPRIGVDVNAGEPYGATSGRASWRPV